MFSRNTCLYRPRVVASRVLFDRSTRGPSRSFARLRATRRRYLRLFYVQTGNIPAVVIEPRLLRRPLAASPSLSPSVSLSLSKDPGGLPLQSLWELWD